MVPTLLSIAGADVGHQDEEAGLELGLEDEWNFAIQAGVEKEQQVMWGSEASRGNKARDRRGGWRKGLRGDFLSKGKLSFLKL